MQDDLSKLIGQLESSQKQNAQAQLGQVNMAREISHDKIANNANSSGLLFSNMPAQQQQIYDAQTYMPQVAKVQSNYLTTTDKINATTQNYLDQLDAYNKTIAEANEDVRKK